MCLCAVPKSSVFQGASVCTRTLSINVRPHWWVDTCTHIQTQELDWLKEASLLDATADVTGDVSGLGLGDDDDDVPDWLKE